MTNAITVSEQAISNKSTRIDQNAAVIYVAGLGSISGRRTMQQALTELARMMGAADVLSCPWGEMRFQHVAAIRSKLLESGKSAATINKYLAALRGALRAAWQTGQMSAEDYHKAVSVKSVKGTTLPAGRELSHGEIAALISACEKDATPAGVRDGAIIALMYSAGLRREEVTALDLADYDPETSRLVVRGKGNKERAAYLAGGAIHALADWLAVRGDEVGALFVSINKGGRLGVDRLTPQAIYNMLNKRATDAGVKRFSPHDLRRTFVSDLLDAGADIVTVAKMAGHANVSTTARYDRRPEDAKRKASNLLHVPYNGRS